jgi:hypothetical protein
MRVPDLFSRTLAAIRGGSRRRKATIIVGLAVAALAVAVGPALGVLTGSPSNFESGDGNMKVDTTGNHDWANVSFVGTPDPFNTTADNSFVSGQKQDTPCPDVDLSHKNPPKDDFKKVARYSEVSGSGHTFFYGATVRYASNGNASENIELNKGTSGTCDSGLLQRTAGDRLIAIDYTGSTGTAADFHVLTWITSGQKGDCFVSNDVPPCWGASVLTLSAAAAEGKENQSPIPTAENPITNEDLDTGQFAEFGIDLTAAGIIPANSCSPFAQTIWESRSSGSSFVSTTKDIVVDNVSFSNCGEIKIIKHTDPRGLNQQFSYTSNLPTVPSGGDCSGVDGSGNFCLNDNGNTAGDSGANTVDETNLPPNTYTVTEGADPTGFALESLSCSGGTTSTSGKTATITLAANDVVTCTYVNQQQLGAIKITKTSSKAAATPLSGASFSVKSGGTAISGSPFTTDSAGTVCVDGLPFGTYAVKEEAAPTGYAIDDTASHNVTVDNSASCSDATYGGESISFTDTPLTDLSVESKSEAAGGTKSQITCVDSNSADVGDSPSGNVEDATVTANGLSPGTYTCTVVIDP